MPIIGVIDSSKLKVTGSFESIASFVSVGGESTATFSSIPQTYKHLHIRWISRQNAAGTYMFARLNNTTGYTNGSFAFDGTLSGAQTTSNSNIQWNYGSMSSNATANMFACGIADIIDYTSTTKLKTVRSYHGWQSNSAAANAVELSSHLAVALTNANAVTSMTFFNDQGNFVLGTSIALYGIKG